MRINTNVWEKHQPALERALDLRHQGKTWTQIATSLSNEFGDLFTYDAVVSKIRSHLGKKAKNKHQAQIQAPLSEKKYVIFSDLHIPFEHNLVSQKIQEHADKKATLVLDGDLLDMFCCSKFVQDRDIALKDEILTAYGYLRLWATLYEEIIIIPGNHEDRLRTYLYSRIGNQVQFLFDANILNIFTIGTKFDYYAVDRVSEQRLEIEYEIKPIPNLRIVNNWWVQIGDAIIAHPKSFYRAPGKTVVETDNFFQRHKFEYRALIIGHTHQTARFTPGGERLLLEIGCNCKELEYAMSGKVTYTPQVNAFALLFQQDGVTDLNKSAFILY